MKRPWRWLLAAAALSWGLANGPNSAVAAEGTTTDLAGYSSVVAPFLAKHCGKCHGGSKPEADLKVSALDSNLLEGRHIEEWKKIADKLALDEMPPEDEPRPNAKQAAAVLAWIKAELTKGGEDTADIGRSLLLPGHGNRVNHEALFSADPGTPSASPGRLWRLSPQIYVSFVPRVVGKGHAVGQPFSTSSGEGFKDYAGLFIVDEPTINQLLRNAQQIVAVQSGQVKNSKPIKEFAPLFSTEKPGEEEIRTAIRRQFQLALLREPSNEELERFVALLQKNMQDAGQEIGVRMTLAAVLMLPETMYRFELGKERPDEFGRRMLAPREIAYSLAFALTDEPPDAALLKTAESGRLATREDVRREVERMLADKSLAKPRIMRFFDEYFEYPAVIDVFKDIKRGQWRPEILVADTRQLIQHVLDQDRDVLKQLLTTNKSFVNYKVDAKGIVAPAREVKKKEPPKIDSKTGQPKPAPPRQPEIHDWYSLPEEWQWTATQPIELPPAERAGVLTQPSWLAAFATNNENHAIRRGKWVRERLLGNVVPDLPISVDAQLPDAPDQTLRERMKVTTQDYCWQCHRKMNPLGLAFEHYDYLGHFRRTESVLDPVTTAKNLDKKGKPQGDVLRDVPIDASGVVAHSGEPKIEGNVKNAVEMIHRLADSPRVRQVFVRHAFRYWMGRNETLADGPTLVAADRAYVESHGSLKALITALLSSDSFLYRS